MHVQLRPYSCSASVLQMIVRELIDEKISHADAIQLTECKPDGCTMRRLQKALREFGIVVGKCAKRQTAIRKALDDDKLVIIDDNRTYDVSHVTVIPAYVGKRFWVADPMRPLPRLNRGKDVIKRAEECFTAYVR
jgi:hypothetical protein